MEAENIGRRITLESVPVQSGNGDGSELPPCTKTIVLDGSGGMRHFFGGMSSLIGDFQVLRSRVLEFAMAFRRAGVNLVVFVDGTVPADKFGTWLGRRRSDAKDVAALNLAREALPLPSIYLVVSSRLCLLVLPSAQAPFASLISAFKN